MTTFTICVLLIWMWTGLISGSTTWLPKQGSTTWYTGPTWFTTWYTRRSTTLPWTTAPPTTRPTTRPTGNPGGQIINAGCREDYDQCRFAIATVRLNCIMSAPEFCYNDICDNGEVFRLCPVRCNRCPPATTPPAPTTTTPPRRLRVDETCVTTLGGNGWTPGSRCVFPFYSSGTWHDRCIANTKGPWCYTAERSSDAMINIPWGYCDLHTCNYETCDTRDGRHRWTTGSKCQFPFYDHGNMYHVCKGTDGPAWCHTEERLSDVLGHNDVPWAFCDVDSCRFGPYFYIKHNKSELYLDVASQDHDKIQLWTFHGRENQQFFWDGRSLRSRAHPGRMITLSSDYDTDRNTIGDTYMARNYDVSDLNRQKWKYEDGYIKSFHRKPFHPNDVPFLIAYDVHSHWYTSAKNRRERFDPAEGDKVGASTWTQLWTFIQVES